MEINVISGQKQSVILGIPWLAYHNSEINWRMREVKIMKYLKEYEKQQRPKQRKLKQQKQKEEEKKQKEKEKRKKKKKRKKENKKEKEAKQWI